MQNTLYADAVGAVREAAETRRTCLDRKAAEARGACLKALRAACTEAATGRNEADYIEAEAMVCTVVAQTIEVGRAGDGYPQINLPERTRKLVTAAVHAGVIHAQDGNPRIGSLVFHKDMSGLRSGIPNEWHDDMTAWREATDFQAKQTWGTL